MGKSRAKRNALYVTICAVVFVLLFNAGLGFSLQSKYSHTHVTTPTPKQSVQKKTEIFSYKGEVGKDALSLLKTKTSVEQNSSGLVTLINGRKADDNSHEYWAFYVNGKMAEVGPAENKTKNGDTIEWKIERY